MSHAATDWAIRSLDKCTNVTTRLLLILLADCHNGHSGECFPQIATLMRLTGLAETAVKDGIRALEAAGLVKREQIFHPNGRTKGVQYHLLMDGVNPPVKGAENRPVKGSDNRPHGVGEPTPSKDNREKNHDTRSARIVTRETTRKRADKVLIPEDLTFTQEMLDFALKEGLTDDEARREFDAYRDDADANARRHTLIGWSGAAWRNWIRSPYCASHPRNQRRAGAVAPRRNGQGDTGWVGAGKRALARLAAQRGGDGRDEVDPFEAFQAGIAEIGGPH